VSRPDTTDAGLETVLDALERGEALVRRATWLVAELEEALDEGQASRDELAAALLELERAEALADKLRRKRAEAEAAMDRHAVLMAHGRRARG
jgi:exonuclease VII small subunit